jgi:ADP-heptose:LPS heptosyltransferase
VLAALRAGMPERRIVYVGRDSFGDLARAAGLVDGVISEDSPEVVALHSQVSGAGEAFSRRVGSVALAVSFLGSKAVTQNLLGAGAAEVLVSSAKPVAGAGVHAADHLISALRGRLDVPPSARPRIDVPADVGERARATLHKSGTPQGQYLVLQPGSGSLAKNWPAERFGELASLAREGLGLAVVLVLGPAELEREPRDADNLRSVADATLESLQLPLLAGLLSDAAAYVGNDSGVTHLAAACGAPTVAVFGPTDPGVWAPRGPHVRVVRSAHSDLAEVATGDVLEALRSLVLNGP